MISRAFALFFIILGVAVALEISNTQNSLRSGKITGNNGKQGIHVLELIDSMIRRLSKSTVSPFGSEFRDENGKLLVIENVLVDVTPPTKCSGGIFYGDSQIKSKNPSGTLDLAYSYSLDLSGLYSCFYISGDLGPININSDDGTNAKKPTISLTDGVTCENCFASVGSKMEMSASCSIGSPSKCSIAFSTGGGIAFNADLEIKDPQVSVSTVYPVYTGTSTVIFDDPEIGTKISVTPSLSIGIYGNLKGSGDASIKASFDTEAKFGVSYSLGDAVPAVGLSESVSLGAPNVNAGLQLTMSDIIFSVLPTVKWDIFLGELVGTGSGDYIIAPYNGAGILTTITTPINGSYGFTSVFENGQITESQSSLDLSVSASLDKINAIFDSVCTIQEPEDPSTSFPCIVYELLPSPVASPLLNVFDFKTGSQALGVAASPPPSKPPTDAPPTDAPPTDAPPTGAPPTGSSPTDPKPTDSAGDSSSASDSSASISLSSGQLTLIVGLATVGGLFLVGLIVYSIILLGRFNKIMSTYHQSNEEMYVDTSKVDESSASNLGDMWK